MKGELGDDPDVCATNAANCGFTSNCGNTVKSIDEGRVCVTLLAYWFVETIRPD